MDAFDADVVIYAATPGHVAGERVRALFDGGAIEANTSAGIGSVLLIPEILSKPIRDERVQELKRLTVFLSRITLISVDRSTAELASVLAASYGLRATDAVHLATAVANASDRFITNNRSDFPKSITEIDVTYPEDLPDNSLS